MSFLSSLLPLWPFSVLSDERCLHKSTRCCLDTNTDIGLAQPTPPGHQPLFAMAFPPPSAYAHDPVPAPTTTTATTTATFTPASRNTSAQASAHATTVEDDVRVRRLREEVEDRVRMLRYSHRRNTERVVTAMARDTEEFKSWKDRTIESLQGTACFLFLSCSTCLGVCVCEHCSSSG